MSKTNDLTAVSTDGLEWLHLERERLQTINKELLEALEAAQWHLMGKARKDPTEQEIVYKITEAINKARGES